MFFLDAAGARRGSLQLWQFLVALLDEPAVAAGCIAWTGRGLEFKLLEPEEVLYLTEKLTGMLTNRSNACVRWREDGACRKIDQL